MVSQLVEVMAVYNNEPLPEPMSTHLPRDKMVASIADDIFRWNFMNENIYIVNQISLKFFSEESNWQ